MTWVSENKATAGLIGLLIVACLFWLRGCSGPGEVSPKAYEFAKTIMQILNRRDDPRMPKDRSTLLTEARERIVSANESGEISSSELELLTDIVDHSLNGNETTAKAAVRELMEAQVH